MTAAASELARGMRIAQSRLGVVVLMGGMLLGSTAAAQSETPAPEAEGVDFEISLCLASSEPGEIESACRSIHEQLPAVYRSMLGSLRFQERQSVRLSFNEPKQVGLPTGNFFQMRPLQIVDQRVHMQVEMRGVMSTQLRLMNGRSLIFSGGPHRNGELLVELKPSFDPSIQTIPAPAAPPSRVASERGPRRPPSPQVDRASGTRPAPNSR